MREVTREHPEFQEGSSRVALLALFFVLNTPVVGMQNPKRMPYSAELILHSYVTFIAAKEQHALFGKSGYYDRLSPSPTSLSSRGR
jgi:hypothetical protein